MLKPTKILITDDDNDVLMLLRVQLERAGFEVIMANDGLEALEQVKQAQPTIALLDWMMPNLDGIEACRRIRQEHKDIYIIILSAIDNEQRKAEALEAGANDYRTKPMSGQKLVSLLQEILA